MKAILLLTGLLVFTNCSFARDTAYLSVTQQLLKIDELDQRYRNQINGIETKYGRNSNEMQTLYKQMQLADSANQLQVVAILDTYGWLGVKEIGEQANTTLFMVIQHAGKAMQEKYLPIMRAAVKNGKAKARSLALLEDRVAIQQGRMQNYGSQVFFNSGTNQYFVLPLDDPDNVDERRAAVGLQPLAGYLSAWNLKWDAAQYKKDLPLFIAECKKIIPACCSKY